MAPPTYVCMVATVTGRWLQLAICAGHTPLSMHSGSAREAHARLEEGDSAHSPTIPTQQVRQQLAGNITGLCFKACTVQLPAGGGPRTSPPTPITYQRLLPPAPGPAGCQRGAHGAVLVPCAHTACLGRHGQRWAELGGDRRRQEDTSWGSWNGMPQDRPLTSRIAASQMLAMSWMPSASQPAHLRVSPKVQH